MSTRKIAVVTGTRAEYGLLYWLIKRIEADEALELQLLVTGMHLSPEFGLTYKDIEAEFPIAKKIEMLLSSDTPVSISKSMALGQIGFAEAYEQLKPDIVVMLGDRYELLCAASAAMISQVPICHIHGGESTEGAVDEGIRHSITKMSHLHFTATEVYRHRVIQLGEHPERVFNIGGMGIENIKKLNLLTKESLEHSLSLEFERKNILITFHPETLGDTSAKKQFSEVLKALDKLSDTKLIFTKANSDAEGRVINSMIDDYVRNNSAKSAAFVSLGQLRYLSVLQFVDAVVGNSSSGLLEAPSFKIGTINIGDRQKSRVKADSVIDCKPDAISITQALSQLYSASFQQVLKMVNNPYDQGCSSEYVMQRLKSISFDNIVKKTFYDVSFKYGIEA